MPALYGQNNAKYPLLIFLPGAGQYGTGSAADLAKVLTEGTPVWLKQQKFPSNFLVNGQNFSFIVLVPQFKVEPRYADLRAFIDYAFSKYRINRSYFTSQVLAWDPRQTAEFGALEPSVPAAIITMAGAFYVQPARHR